MNCGMRFSGLIGSASPLTSRLSSFENLLHDFLVQHCVGVEGDRHPQRAISVDPVTTFRAEIMKPAASKARPASNAVHRGSLGIHLNGGREDLAAEEKMPFVSGQGFEVQFDGFFDVRDRFFKRVALRVTPLQFRAPGVERMLVLLDQDTRLPGHRFSVSPRSMTCAFIGRNRYSGCRANGSLPADTAPQLVRSGNWTWARGRGFGGQVACLNLFQRPSGV